MNETEIQIQIQTLQERYNDVIRIAFQCEEFGKFNRADALFKKADDITAKINALKEQVK